MRDLVGFRFLDCGIDLILAFGVGFWECVVGVGRGFGRLFENVLLDKVCLASLFFILLLFVKSIAQLACLYPFFV